MFSDLMVLTGRQLQGTVRMPFFVAIAIIQPVLWLFLFGNAFAARLSSSEDMYIAQLIPGFAVLSAYFGSAYAGMYLLQDAERGVIHRQLSAPVSRVAIPLSYVLHAAMVVVVQASIILAMTLFLDSGIQPGPSGVLTTLMASILIAIVFASASIALALASGRSEAVLGVVNFLGLPLLFLSQILTIEPLEKEWMRMAANLNPINWAVVLARSGYADFPLPSRLSVILLIVLAVAAAAGAICVMGRYVRRL